MHIRTRQRGGSTEFFLCISESGGQSASGWKTVEYSVRLGQTLELTSLQWVKILQGSATFRSVRLTDVLEVLERYVAEHQLRPEILDGLRQAARASRWRKTKRETYREPPGESLPPDDARMKALRLLGLAPGASDKQVESAFRKAARRHHPDVGGDAERFRAILDARNFLLG